MIRLRSAAIVTATGIWAAAMLGGCSSAGDGGASDPEIDAARMDDRDRSTAERAAALESLWASAQGQGDEQIDAAREQLKVILWKGGAPQALRESAFACLISDERPAGIADTANFLRLRLPTEPQYGVLKAECEAIARGAASGDPVWRTTASGLVRSWSRKLAEPPDDRRPERSALAALFPERSVEETVFQVFLVPTDFGAKPDSSPDPSKPASSPLLGGLGGGASAPDSASRVRAAAWDVLGRIDESGERRAALLADGGVGAGDGDALIAGLRRAARELGVVPITGSELSWLQTLLDSNQPRVREWWSAASSAVAELGIEQRTGLQLRHIEATRWSAQHRPEWLRSSRQMLWNELNSRLTGRKTHRIGEAESDAFYVNRNRPSDWDAQLAWGDLLTVLVLDEAIAIESVRASIGQQADADRADTSTEWGGSIFDTALRQPGGSGFEAVPYQSRPAQRINDRTFVAGDEMFGEEGALGLVHYHFHAQVVRNAAYAGPGKGDREYASQHNRNCMVFTPVREGVFNADYYQRGGATIDLGEVVVPK